MQQVAETVAAAAVAWRIPEPTTTPPGCHRL
jgi:hypothetical protein